MMNNTKHLIIISLLSLCLLTIGTLGYMQIEHWSFLDGLYMTIITLATVGYCEVHQISPAGRIFTIILILLGVGFFLYVVGSVVQFLVEGRIREVLGRRKLDKQIDKLENHFVVCGYGRMGRTLCSYLIQKYLDIVVIERNPERIPAMNEDGVLYIVGEATEEAKLIKAGIRRARGLFAGLGSDADDIFLVLLAKGLNPDLFIVARANQNAAKRTLYSAGVNKVVAPHALGARRMAHAVLRPTVIKFLELAFADDDTDIFMEEVSVGSSAKLVGVSLQDSGIRKDLNLMIIAIKRADGSMVFNPKADARIKAGDTLVAVGRSKKLAQLSRML